MSRICDAPCPLCGGVVELVTDGLVGELIAVPPTYHHLEYRMRQVPFGACTSCEFCIDIQPGGRDDAGRDSEQSAEAVAVVGELESE